jgi:hypothetical protein
VLRRVFDRGSFSPLYTRLEYLLPLIVANRDFFRTVVVRKLVGSAIQGAHDGFLFRGGIIRQLCADLVALRFAVKKVEKIPGHAGSTDTSHQGS